MTESPLATLRIGRIKATVWENHDKDGIVYHVTTLSRSYRDAGGEWQEANTFSLDDLPRLRLAVEQAYARIHERMNALRQDQAQPADRADHEAGTPSKSTRKRAARKTAVERIDEQRSSKGRSRG